jgi:hypothetical protein
MAEKVMDLNRFVDNGGNAPHKPIHVKIDDADTLTFLCDDPFEITEIKRHPNGPSENPFHRSTLPFGSTRGSDDLHRTNSGSPKPDTRTRRYKVSAVVYTPNGSKPIDPDFIVD